MTKKIDRVEAAIAADLREKSDVAAARFIKAYWRMPKCERELFLEAIEARGVKWTEEWGGPEPKVLEHIALVERRDPEDPRRNLRPTLKLVRR